MHVPEFVLLGGPDSGKTHFSGQLYGRVRRRPGQLRLSRDRGTPQNLEPLEQVLRCLEDGRSAPHTPTSRWAEVELPLVDARGNALNLRWPDFGGEQLRAVSEQRAVSEAWRMRIARADHWLMLIRITSEIVYPDAFAELTNHKGGRTVNAARAGSWDANARLVEFLQILLHVAGHGVVRRLVSPRLAVLLSCYDELGENHGPPRDVLASRLPLVAAFIRSNWAADAASIWGLSALGRPLDSKLADVSFVDSGPESHGWIVAPDGGEPDPDLSKPLAWLLGAA